MRSRLLDGRVHDRDGFDCGVEALNRYLKVQASQQGKRDNSRTYVLLGEDRPERIRGYYTLTLATVDLSRLPARLHKRHPQAYAAGLIARLAVDRRDAGAGLGEWLLVDALGKLVQTSETIGFPLIVVDAKAGVSAFYERFGFTPFSGTPDRLFITVADVRESLGG